MKRCGLIILCVVGLLSGGCFRPHDGTFTQKGSLRVEGFGPFEVFYPIPFPSPPNLTLSPEPPLGNVLVITQRVDGFTFKINATGMSPGKLAWVAVGQRPPAANRGEAPAAESRVAPLLLVILAGLVLLGVVIGAVVIFLIVSARTKKSAPLSPAAPTPTKPDVVQTNQDQIPPKL